MRVSYTFVAAIPCVCAMLSGCATPQPVLELARQGVAIASKTEAELDEFTNRSHRLYLQRLESIKRLSIGNIEARAATDFENYTVQRAGMSDRAEMMDLIKELADYRAKARENALSEKAELEKTLAPLDAIKVPKEKMAELRKALAELSQELSDKEWLEFSISFGKQVNESRKEAKDSANEAEEKANGGEKKVTESAKK